MKEIELTDEMIEDATKCDGKIACCVCRKKGDRNTTSSCVAELAAALQAERAKPKDDVWKDAPEQATVADVAFYRASDGYIHGSARKYTRERPKSRIDLIAEKSTLAYFKEWGTDSDSVLLSKLPTFIKAAILEAMGGEK